MVCVSLPLYFDLTNCQKDPPQLYSRSPIHLSFRHRCNQCPGHHHLHRVSLGFFFSDLRGSSSGNNAADCMLLDERNRVRMCQHVHSCPSHHHFRDLFSSSSTSAVGRCFGTDVWVRVRVEPECAGSYRRLCVPGGSLYGYSKAKERSRADTKAKSKTASETQSITKL